MKKYVVFLSLLLVTLTGAACAQEEGSTPTGELETLEQRASYAIGMNIAQGMKAQDVPVDVDLLIQGLRDAMGDGETRLDAQEMQTALQEFQQQMMQRAQAAREEAAQENEAEAKAFFAEHADAEGVTVTDSGIHYMVMEEGDGPKPTADDRVTVHYKGELLDGTVFDSSYDRGQPATFPVGGVIQGWQEALQLMPVGSKYKLWIPPELAYGASGQGPVIGPNEALVFEVELLEIAEEAEGQGGQGSAGGQGGR